MLCFQQAKDMLENEVKMKHWGQNNDFTVSVNQGLDLKGSMNMFKNDRQMEPIIGIKYQYLPRSSSNFMKLIELSLNEYGWRSTA